MQRNQFDFIPNDLYRILKEGKNKTYFEIKENLSSEDIETLDEYFDFLLKREYGFWCSYEELDSFPEIDLSFQTPSHITNAIIDVDTNSNHDLNKIYSQLEDLGCKDLQIRFFSQISFDDLVKSIRPLATNRIRSLQLVIQASPEFTEDNLKELCRTNMKIVDVVVSLSQEDKISLAGVDEYTRLTFTKQKIDSCNNCGIVHFSYFTANMQAFSESQHYNSCLNRKISVDINGNIKNCPSMSEDFGNVNEVSFKDVLKREDFKKRWGIHKDQILVCMDCEFRHICTDCRAYLSDPTNLYSKPKKCTYDPYSATWQNHND